MTMQEAIYKRRSTRDFDTQPLSAEQLADFEAFVNEKTRPLFPDIEFECKMVNGSVRGFFAVQAPHYMLFYSKKTEGYLPNTGFILQQLDLYLSAQGIGSCWLGVTKPGAGIGLPKKSGLQYVVMLAIGKSKSTPYRTPDEFKRLTMEEISTPADARLEPARLAPSASNGQPWQFVPGPEGFEVYCVPKRVLFADLNRIDIGIALAHLYICNPDTFRFDSTAQPAEERPGQYYMGRVSI